MKWFVIGLLSTLVVLFLSMLFTELGRGGGAGISTILTTHSYEALMGMIAIVGHTAGLVLVVPTIVIAVAGFFIEKRIKISQQN